MADSVSTAGDCHRLDEQDLIEARAFARAAHADQRYGNGAPYFTHLDAVEAVLVRFGFEDDYALRIGAQLHDTVEDTSVRLADVVERFGSEVASLVDAVTNRPGRNRAARHAATYPVLRAAGERAVTLKLSDRIANVEAGGRLVGMYRKEYPGFRREIHRKGECRPMWDHLDRLLGYPHRL